MSRKHLDQFDLEAEAEYLAISAMRSHGAGPCVAGKRITKTRKMHEKGNIKQDNRVKGRYLIRKK